MAIWGGKNRAVVAGLLWGEDPAWKPIYAPYHISLHGLTCARVIFYLSWYLYGAGGLQNMAIWGVKTGYYCRLVMEWVKIRLIHFISSGK